MDTLERIEREYEIRQEMITRKLQMQREERAVARQLRKAEKIKNLVRYASNLAIILVMVAFVSLGVWDKVKPFTVDWEEETYVVEQGDTLWTIGKEVCGESTDIREWVYNVMWINDMDSSDIYPNEVIKILVPKEDK